MSLRIDSQNTCTSNPLASSRRHRRAFRLTMATKRKLIEQSEHEADKAMRPKPDVITRTDEGIEDSLLSFILDANEFPKTSDSSEGVCGAQWAKLLTIPRELRDLIYDWVNRESNPAKRYILDYAPLNHRTTMRRGFSLALVALHNIHPQVLLVRHQVRHEYRASIGLETTLVVDLSTTTAGYSRAHKYGRSCPLPHGYRRWPPNCNFRYPISRPSRQCHPHAGSDKVATTRRSTGPA